MSEETKAKGGWGETIKIFIHAALIAIVIRTLFFQPFSIPSGSMKDTLLVGDYLFVSKYAYGYSRFSLPFSPPLWEGRIWAGAPARGDVVVFRNPAQIEQDFIKRVIGLPGDRIQVIQGVVNINGTPIRRERIGDFVDANPLARPSRAARFRETLPNGVTYTTLSLDDDRTSMDNTPVYTVPPGHVFVMGDNRDDSQDSRYPFVGPIPIENLVGRAEILFFSLEDGESFWQFWRWPVAIRWTRLLNPVR